MSTAYYKVARPVATTAPRGAFGLGARALALVAVGAIGGYLLREIDLPRTQVAPAPEAAIERIALPEMDASMGFWDIIDTRPAVSTTDISMGFWDTIDTRPYVSPFEANQGYWEQVDARPAVSAVAGQSVDITQGYFATTADRPAYGGAATTYLDSTDPWAVSAAGELALGAGATLALSPATPSQAEVVANEQMPRAEVLADAVPYEDLREGFPPRGLVFEGETPRFVVRETAQGYEGIAVGETALTEGDEQHDGLVLARSTNFAI
jgi:hypothetical protein